MATHRTLHGGISRPKWAGPVHSRSRERTTSTGQLARSVEVSGLVLPISVPGQLRSGSIGHTFGLSLGFPHLGEELLADLPPEIWDSWGRLEPVVVEAATRTMSWDATPAAHRAAHMPPPAHAIHLRLTTRGRPSAGTSQLDTVTGEIAKVFAIRDVSGSQLRFESAGAAATFSLTKSSAHWSRDPRMF